MSKKRKSSSFLKQAAILASAGMIVRFIGFLYRLPMSALIGNEGNAIYGAGYQVYNLLLILSSAGLPAAIGKMVSERLAKKQYRNAHKVFLVSLAWSSGISFLFMILLLVFANTIAVKVCKIPGAYYTLLTLAPTIFIVGIMSVFRGYFQGMNNMVPTAVSQIVEQLFNAVFSVFLAWILVKKSIALGAAGGTAGTGIGALAGLLVVVATYFLMKPKIKRKLNAPIINYKEESAKEIGKILLCTAVPIIIGTAIYSITNLADMSMVMDRLLVSGAFSEEEATVLYGQLQGKYVVLTTLPVAISTAMATAAVPNIAASMALKDKAAVQRKINMAIKIAMIISIPAAVGMGVLAHQILLMLFPTMPDGGDLLAIGSISIIFLALSQIVTGTLQGIGKVKTPAINAACGAVVKIILNYVLIVIPAINVKGAVISTIVCYAVASTLNLRALIKATKFTPDLSGALLKPTIAAIAMGLACYFSYKGAFALKAGNTISTLVAIIVSIGVYGFVMLIIKGITKDDLGAVPGGKKLIVVLEKLKLL
ncbi:MAG: polysaccharide biosynthesis protein [Lachnospiraceae bacterium]|nr:polysaccharide biosynthesis protein [Lachnospiraceae bacterium]